MCLLISLTATERTKKTKKKLTSHQWVARQPPVDVQRILPWLWAQWNLCLNSSHDENVTTADSSTTVQDSSSPSRIHKPEVGLPPFPLLSGSAAASPTLPPPTPRPSGMDVVFSMCMTMDVRMGLCWWCTPWIEHKRSYKQSDAPVSCCRYLDDRKTRACFISVLSSVHHFSSGKVDVAVKCEWSKWNDYAQ